MDKGKNILSLGILLLLIGVCFGKNEVKLDEKEQKIEEVQEVFIYDLQKQFSDRSSSSEIIESGYISAQEERFLYRLDKKREKYFLVFNQLKIECN